jgi:hypothetical protein
MNINVLRTNCAPVGFIYKTNKNISAFWYILPCSIAPIYRRFGETYYPICSIMLHFYIRYRLAFSYYSATGHQFHNLLYRFIHFVRYYTESFPCASDVDRWYVCPYLVSSARCRQNTMWRVAARGVSFLSSIGPAWLQQRITRMLVRRPETVQSPLHAVCLSTFVLSWRFTLKYLHVVCRVT